MRAVSSIACSISTPATIVSSNGVLQVHDAHYLQRFQTGTLTAAEVRRIGFGDAVRSQVLIDRTIAEVAGVARLRCTPLQPSRQCCGCCVRRHGFGL